MGTSKYWNCFCTDTICIYCCVRIVQTSCSISDFDNYHMKVVTTRDESDLPGYKCPLNAQANKNQYQDYMKVTYIAQGLWKKRETRLLKFVTETNPLP